MLALCLALIVAGSFCMMAYAAVTRLGYLPLGLRLSIPLAWAFVIILTAWREWHQYRKSLHIDISENGQITVEEDNGINPARRKNLPAQAGSVKEEVALRHDSTLWQSLLLLRLERQDGRRINVVILPDCMSRESFRALRVACSWIAARREHVERKI
jgi:hypothetical protein